MAKRKRKKRKVKLEKRNNNMQYLMDEAKKREVHIEDWGMKSVVTYLRHQKRTRDLFKRSDS